MMKKVLTTITSIFLFFSLYSHASAQTVGVAPMNCGIAEATESADKQHWDIVFCASATTKAAIEGINAVKVTCRAAPGPIPNSDLFQDVNNKACHPDDWLAGALGPPASQVANVSVTKFGTINDSSYTCFSFTAADRNMSLIDITIMNGQNSLCTTSNARVTAGNYSWKEYYNNILSGRFNIELPVLKPNLIRCQYSIRGLEGVSTAIGCIPFGYTSGQGSPASQSAAVEFTAFILRWLLGFTGGIGILMIIFAGLRIATSAGNPEQLKSGQSLLVSAITGILMIIFSIFLVRIIGINILGIF